MSGIVRKHSCAAVRRRRGDECFAKDGCASRSSCATCGHPAVRSGRLRKSGGHSRDQRTISDSEPADAPVQVVTVQRIHSSRDNRCNRRNRRKLAGAAAGLPLLARSNGGGPSRGAASREGRSHRVVEDHVEEYWRRVFQDGRIRGSVPEPQPGVNGVAPDLSVGLGRLIGGGVCRPRGRGRARNG